MLESSVSDSEPPSNVGVKKCISIIEGNFLYSKLQCVQCGKCLSVTPVSEKEGRYTCGRCYPGAEHCLLYTAVAEHFQFPCIFQGCEAKLKWGTVKYHEKTCLYRNVSCSLPECADRYQFISFQSHFENSHAVHKEQYSSDDLSLDKLSLSTPYMNLHCMVYREIIFLVFIKIHKQICCGDIKGVCQFSIFSLVEKVNLPNLECELKINITSNITVMETINLKNAENFIDTQHCLSCMIEFCNKPDHSNIGDSFLTHVLEFPTKSKAFSYNIKLYEKSSLKALPIIECPICNNYFSEPIYLCPTGHSLCSQCYDSITECPFCRVKLFEEPIRNYALEALINECSNTDSN